MENNEIRTDANRRQTESNEACFNCRGANRWSSEEEPSSLELSRVATEEGKANEETPEGGNDSRNAQKEIKKMRGDLIFCYYQWWKTEHPEKKIFNKALGDYIHVNHDSITETVKYAQDKYESTTAVLHLDEILSKATFVKEVNSDTSSSRQKAYEKMIIMKHHLENIGDVRLLVGVKRSDRTTKVQYCITVIDLATGNGYNENERHERGMRHRKKRTGR